MYAASAGWRVMPLKKFSATRVTWSLPTMARVRVYKAPHEHEHDRNFWGPPTFSPKPHDDGLHVAR